jgi:membrane fusion protein (multidrug efflux system)
MDRQPGDDVRERDERHSAARDTSLREQPDHDPARQPQQPPARADADRPAREAPARKRDDDGGDDDAGEKGASGKNDDKKDDDKKDDDEDPEQAERRKKARPFVRAGVVLVLLLLIGGGFYYWWSNKDLEDTDDAYTDGRAVTIAPHVAGYVVKLAVNDNEFVHQGQVILQIDQRDYIAARDQAAAALATGEAQVKGQEQATEVAKVTFPAQLQQARANLDAAKANQFKAQTDYNRQHRIDRAATTQADVDASTAALGQANAQVEQAQAALTQATPVAPNIGQQTATGKQRAAAVQQAQASLATAELNLGWTTVRAPMDGWITHRNVNQGDYVQQAQQILSLVSPEVWVTANFKETQLARMRPGQHVNIGVDAYPTLKLRGHVDGIQLGSGSKFTAFPPENATGNYVKIVQRVPVKIVIDSGLDPTRPLPLGISVEPTVELK